MRYFNKASPERQYWQGLKFLNFAFSWQLYYGAICSWNNYQHRLLSELRSVSVFGALFINSVIIFYIRFTPDIDCQKSTWIISQSPPQKHTPGQWCIVCFCTRVQIFALSFTTKFGILFAFLCVNIRATDSIEIQVTLLLE